jgi:hypothetical protein
MAANLLPVNFPIQQSSAIASYSYTDVAEGTGVVVYYLAAGHDGTNPVYFLTTNSSLGSMPQFSYKVLSGTIIDQKFDVTFNMPKRIKGNIYADISTARRAGNNGYITVEVTVYHYDGSTETSLGTATTTTPSNSTANSLPRDCYVCLKIPIVLTKFKKGHILRVKLVATASNDSAASFGNVIGHNPSGGNGGDSLITTTQSAIYVPFVLNL